MEPATYMRNKKYEADAKRNYDQAQKYYQKAIKAYPLEAKQGAIGKTGYEDLKRKARGLW